MAWYATRYGWFSVVCARNGSGGLDKNTVMIRARRKAHLQNLQKRFPETATVEVRVTPRNDYHFRLIIPKAQWAHMAGEMAMEMEYGNFKEEAARWQGRGGADYVHALHKVWAVMNRLQN